MPKVRIDQLVSQKFNMSITEASALIMERRVLVNDVPITQPGTQVKEDVVVRLKEKKRKYASRSGYKLEGALKQFSVDPKGKTICDIGASNGGFTDCLLQHGASHVYAVDVAYGILEYRLRQDDRVTVMDRTNARELTADNFNGPLDIVTMDVSFISIKLIFPAIDKILSQDGLCVTLIKPQFEAPQEALGKNGIIKDTEILPGLFQEIIKVAEENHLYIRDLMVSPIHGQNGNVEYLAVWERKPTIDEETINKLTNEAVLWQPMDK